MKIAHDNPDCLKRFGAEMPKALRAAGVEGDIKFDADAFRLTVNGKDTLLSGAYVEYAAAPERDRDAILAKYARDYADSTTPLPTSLKDTDGPLFPFIVNRVNAENLRIMGSVAQGRMDDLAFEVVAEHLAAGVTLNMGQVNRELTHSDLLSLGITLQQALEIGRDNLASISGGKWEEIGAGVRRAPWQDTLVAARLLLGERFRRMTNDPVALVPNDGTLLITDAANESGLVKMAEIGQEVPESPDMLSGYPLRLKGSTWERFTVPPNHPAYERFRILGLKTEEHDYFVQSGALTYKSGRQGLDGARIADFHVRRTRDGVRSECLWDRRERKLLPKADHVLFTECMGARGTLVILGGAPWERVVKLAGHLMKPQGLFPERYLVEAFPTDRELRAMRLEDPAVLRTGFDLN